MRAKIERKERVEIQFKIIDRKYSPKGREGNGLFYLCDYVWSPSIT